MLSYISCNGPKKLLKDYNCFELWSNESAVIVQFNGCSIWTAYIRMKPMLLVHEAVIVLKPRAGKYKSTFHIVCTNEII